MEPESFGSTTGVGRGHERRMDGDVDIPEVLEVQQAAASAGAWNAVYVLSAVAGLKHRCSSTQRAPCSSIGAHPASCRFAPRRRDGALR